MDSFSQLLNHFLFVDDSISSTKIELKNNIYSIGRHSSSSIILDSPAISRHHATLIRKDLANNEFAYILIDGDLYGKRSQNGILVNGKKKIRHQLNHGDLIVLGIQSIIAIYQVENKINNPKYQINNLLNSRDELHQTLILSEQDIVENLKESNLENIKTLASFPELSPYPIIELNLNNEITYSNPSAKLYFGNLSEKLDLDHYLIEGLDCNYNKENRQINIREIRVNDKYFEQYIHYLSEGKVIRFYIFDITERKKSEEKLKYHAFHDYLTGIANREHFYWQLTKSILENKEEKLAIILIDIDRFKNVNDTLSHTVGDELLENFAFRLSSELSSDCFFARWGGDEFSIIVHNIQNEKKIEEIINTINNSLKNPFLINNNTIYITCSLGIALYPENGKNEEELVKNADIALFRAKQKGKNDYEFYTTIFNSEQRLLFELENKLYDALNNQELFLNFQPQLDLNTQKIYGFETLLRWKNPELGTISPAKFIPIAEESGLIIPIGEWVLKEACLQSKLWQVQGYTPMITAVNVSAKQFQQSNFVIKVKEILNFTDLSPEYLELEITESILMQDHKKTENTIQELTDLGIKFSLDDFGTGYSSLSYLKRFPFHTIKIDKSFIDDVTTNEQDQALISAIITLSKGYKMRVVAEGVETYAQLEILKQYQCDLIQGKCLTMPISADEFTKFLDKFYSNNAINY